MVDSLKVLDPERPIREGEVTVSWTIAGNSKNGTLKLEWRERGGQPAAAPERSGFGTSLLKATLGQARIEYAKQGLSYEVDVPLGKFVPDLAGQQSIETY